MIRNYLKITIRNLWRNKRFASINIIGLSLGMACSLLILLWITDEYKIDASYPNSERLFQVYTRAITNGVVSGGYSTAGLLSEELKRQIPEIQEACSYAFTQPATLSAKDKIFSEATNYASADYFSMFGYQILEGDPKSALSTLTSITISRKVAAAFFGSPAAAMGKVIRVENQTNYTVTAVFEDLPPTVSDRFECLINYSSFMQQNDWLQRWGNSGPFTFILIRPTANAGHVASLVSRFLDTYVKPSASFREELGLQRASDKYLHSTFVNGYPSGGRIEYVRLFSAIALFILLIACINFMNLSTARSTKRALEIGVRKVIGARRGLLIWQFIGESLLLACFALTLAVALVILALPFFIVLTKKNIQFPYGDWIFWVVILGLTGFTGLLAGSYPALFLSAFKPIRVLKNTFTPGTSSLLFRKGLVVFQFVISIILIVTTIFITRQINFVRSTQLGYDRENLLYVPLSGNFISRFDVFKSAALQLPGITAISKMSEPPTDLSNSSQDLDWDGKNPGIVPAITQAAVGYDFVSTMKLQLLSGRDFSLQFPGDSNNYIINETALKEIGYRDPIGRRLMFWNRKGSIIGIVKDFHFQSLHEAIKPLILRIASPEEYAVAVVRTRNGLTREAIEGLGKLSKSMNPQFLFSYAFADEEYAKLYKSDEITGSLS
ncbi:MAG TPA: ABC transporter permease, partial [Puia sp.]|nr:ABC transporter permease [Puia sp.]